MVNPRDILEEHELSHRSKDSGCDRKDDAVLEVTLAKSCTLKELLERLHEVEATTWRVLEADPNIAI